MALYSRHVDELRDCEATIKFTHRINDLLDLLNGRRPCEGIRLIRARDRLKVLYINTIYFFPVEC